jgi:hypothetical protein
MRYANARGNQIQWLLPGGEPDVGCRDLIAAWMFGIPRVSMFANKSASAVTSNADGRKPAWT